MLKAKLLAAAATIGTGTTPTPVTPVTGNGLPLNGTVGFMASSTQNVKLIESAGSVTAGCVLNVVSAGNSVAMTAQLIGETTSGPSIGILASATSTVNTSWYGFMTTDNLNSTNIIYAQDTGSSSGSRYIGTMTVNGTSSISIASTGNLTITPTSTSYASGFDVCAVGSSNAIFANSYYTTSATATGTPDVYLLGVSSSNVITQVATATNSPTMTGSGCTIAMSSLSNSLVVYAYACPNAARSSNYGHIYIGAADVSTTANTLNMNGTSVVEPTYTSNIYQVSNPMVCVVNSTSAIVSWYETFASASQINYQAFAYVTLAAGGSVTINQIVRQPVLGNISSYNKRFRLDSSGAFYSSMGVNTNWAYVDYSNFMYSVTPNTTAKTITLGTPIYCTDYFQDINFAPICYNGYSYITSTFPRSAVYNTSYYDPLGQTFKPVGASAWGATFIGNKSTTNVSSGTGTMNSASTCVFGAYMAAQECYSIGYCDTNPYMRESGGIVPYNAAYNAANSGQGGSGSTYYPGTFVIGGYSANVFVSYMQTSTSLLYGPGYGFSNSAPSAQSTNTLTVLNGNTAILGQSGNYYVMFYSTSTNLVCQTMRNSSGTASNISTSNNIFTYSSPTVAGTTLNAVQLAYSTPKYLVASNWYNSGGTGTAQLVIVNANTTFTTITLGTAVSAPFVCASGTKPQLTVLTYSATTGYTALYAGVDASGNIKIAPITVSGNTITVGTVTTLFTGLTAAAIGGNSCLCAVSPTEAMLAYNGKFVLLTYNSSTTSITAGTSYATGATNTTNTALINPNALQFDVPYSGTDRVLAFSVSSSSAQLSITQIHRV